MLAVAIDRERLAHEAVEAEALRRSDSIKTAVLRAVSHDLRSPLMAISTSAGTLARFDDVAQRARTAKICSTPSSRSRERLDHLVGNLLDLSRLQAGAAALRVAGSVPPTTLVARALDQLGEGKDAGRGDGPPESSCPP